MCMIDYLTQPIYRNNNNLYKLGLVENGVVTMSKSDPFIFYYEKAIY